jgi:stress-induced morphogen
MLVERFHGLRIILAHRLILNSLGDQINPVHLLMLPQSIGQVPNIASLTAGIRVTS